MWVAKGRSCAPKVLAARGKDRHQAWGFKFTPYIERALCSYIGERERALMRAHTCMHYEGVV